MNDDLMSAPSRWLELEHARLPYWRIGQGPDLLFVHGWPLDSRTWRNVVPMLSKRFTCHLVDLPGAGRSEYERGARFGVKAMGETVAEIVRALELEGRVGLIGHDSGGSFARLAAAELGDRVAGLALGNTEIPGHHPWRLKALIALMRVRPLRPLWPALLASKTGRWLMMRDAVTRTELIEAELSPLFLTPLLESEARFRGTFGLAGSIAVEDFDIVGEAHRNISAPVVLIWGVDDPWFPIEKCRAMRAELAGPVDLVEVKGSKLLVHEEAPERFAREALAHFTRAFAKELSADSRAGAPSAN